MQQFPQSMMFSPDGSDRPQHEVHPPRHLDDFLISLPSRKLPQTPTSHVHSKVGDSRLAQTSPPASQKSPPAHQTSPPADQTSPPPGQTSPSIVPDAVYSALRKMQEDTMQLWREMQHFINALSQLPPAAPQVASTSLNVQSPGEQHVAYSGISFAQLSIPSLSSISTPLRVQSLTQAKDGGQDVPGLRSLRSPPPNGTTSK